MLTVITVLAFACSATRSLSHDGHPSPNPLSPQGQGIGNVLRHITSLSNTADHYGRSRSIPISRNVVPGGKIWSAVDDFTRIVHRHPNRLDWLVAHVRLLPGDNPRVVTLNAAFSCMDRGKSYVTPIQFSGATDLKTRLNESQVTGNVRYSGPSIEQPDIVSACLSAGEDFDNIPWKGYKPYQAEYRKVHKGEPVKFNPLKKITGTYVDENDFFDRIYNERTDDPADRRVIYDSKHNIPVVVGIPFVTGFRIWLRNENGYRVPQLPLSAVQMSNDAELEAYGVDRGNPPTNSVEVWLRLNSTGMQLVVACFFVVNIYVLAVRNSSQENSERPVDEAVNGGQRLWYTSDKILFAMSVFAALILSAPMAIDTIDGKFDPRPQFEVTTSYTVYYGVRQREFSMDPIQNPYSGCPFLFMSSLSVRNISDGHILDLLMSSALIFLLIVSLTMAQIRDTCAVMSPTFRTLEVWSPWNLYGSISLWHTLLWKNIKPPRFMQLHIRLRGDALRGPSGRALPAVAHAMRKLTVKGMSSKEQRDMTQKWDNLARQLQHQLQRLYSERVGSTFFEYARIELIANVRLENYERFKAMMDQARSWATMRIPRTWEYVTRGVSSIIPGVRSLNWYRTYGRVAPDEVLVMSQTGLIRHMRHIERVLITEDEERSFYEKDGCSMLIGIVASDTPAVPIDLPNGPLFEKKSCCSGFDPANPPGGRLNLLFCEEGIGVDVVFLSDDQVHSNGPSIATEKVFHRSQMSTKHSYPSSETSWEDDMMYDKED